MIGLIVLALAATWLYVSARSARYVALRCKPASLSVFVGGAIFVALALLPFLDEIIGRWQFQRLCVSEAIAWVSPTASKVARARSDQSFLPREGYVFPIQEQAVAYKDSASGDIFYTVKGFHTPGGLLMRAGLGLGTSTSCWPKTADDTNANLKLNELLKRGKE